MKLLHRVVKSSRINENGDPVFIDNTVIITVKPIFSEDNPEDEDALRQRLEKERREHEVQSEISRQVDMIKNQLEQENAEYLQKSEHMRQEIINDAKAQSDEIMKKVKLDSINELENARKKGFEEGFNAGRGEALSQCETYVKTAAQFLSEINSRKEAYFIQNEENLLDISIEMAEKITLEELKTDKNVLFRIVEQAAKNFRNSDYIKISFAKGDVSREVVTDLDFIKTLVGNIPEIEVEVLPEAAEGTVILDNNSEIIDASVPTQLELLKEIMKNSKNKN